MIVRPLPLGLAAVLFAAPAFAQPVPPGPQGDLPPDRVGRIAAVIGAVSFHLAGATEWQVASRNLPITTGTALWVAAPTGGVSPEASLGVSNNRIVLAPATELDVDRLDEQVLSSTQPQGESYWHLRSVATANTYAIHTPRGTVTMATAGRYAVVSGDTDHPTTITVLDGTATLTDVPTSQEIGPGQTLTVTGDGGVSSFTSSIGKAVEDAFLRHVLAEEAPARSAPVGARSPLAPAILSEMTGSEPLYDVGQWTENAEYGPVWYPPTVDYVPYRQGRWAYVAPWGWTWVDDAPWGFAPSHYGRWSQFDGRWGWVPGRDWAPGRPPIYAPALVGFIGGAALGASLGLAQGPLVGWAPLGPHEAYRPTYRVDDRMIQGLNRPTGATIEINNSQTIVNRSAVTIVPTRVLTTSAPVAGAFRSERVGPLGASPVLQYRTEAVPTRATIGATRAVLQQVNPTGLTAPAAHLGEGPRFGGPGRAEPGVAAPNLERPTLERPTLERPGLVGAGPDAPRPALGGAPPQIGPAAILGGAAVGAVAGGLLHPAARPDTLPNLRQRGDMPPGLRAAGPGAIAQPRPPTGPNVLDPAVPNGRRGDDALNGRPAAPAQPGVPRPAPVAMPARPDVPHLAPPAPSAPTMRERLPEVRNGGPAPGQQEPPHPQRVDMPQREFQRPPAEIQRAPPEAQRPPAEAPRAPAAFQRPPAEIRREPPPALRQSPPQEMRQPPPQEVRPPPRQEMRQPPPQEMRQPPPQMRQAPPPENRQPPPQRPQPQQNAPPHRPDERRPEQPPGR